MLSSTAAFIYAIGAAYVISISQIVVINHALKNALQPSSRLINSDAEFYMGNSSSIDAPSSVNLEAAVGLSFDYLKQLGTIAMTTAGGLIALAQFANGDKRFFMKIMIATSFMFIAALLAFLAQFSLVGRVRQSHDLLCNCQGKYASHKKAKKLESIFESTALWLLSIGTGVALQAVFAFGVPG